jgi:hypothetical protein
MDNNERRLDISEKLLKLGSALIIEGTENNDVNITQSGAILVLVSSVILSEKDLFIISEMCSMFTAKKILESQQNMGVSSTDELAKMLGLEQMPLISLNEKPIDEPKSVKKPRQKKPPKNT